MDEAALRPQLFSDLPGWADADLAPALTAFGRSAERLLSGAIRDGSLGLPADAYLSAAAEAGATDAADARAFFEAHFAPAAIRPPAGAAAGFVTGYYEPVVPAALRPDARFTVPLHRRPADLVAIAPGAHPAGLDPALTFARSDPNGRLSEHPDRAEIARGAIDGQGLEIAWLESEVDAFFVHIQGSARLQLADGTALRVGYAGKSGHPYTAIGRVLVEEGALQLEEADMAGLRAWLAAHPARLREILDRNRSYIFFEARSIADETLGPVGAAGVPLTALGSLALDHRIHTYGVPMFLSAPDLIVGGAAFHRLLVAQDTGSAIVGPTRGDIFVGSGDAAGRVAGAIRHAAQFHALLPKPLWRRLAR